MKQSILIFTAAVILLAGCDNLTGSSNDSGTPDYSDNPVIHLDEAKGLSFYFPLQSEYEAGIRIDSTRLSNYTGHRIVAVRVALNKVPIDMNLRIYEEGPSNNSPGSPVYYQSVDYLMGDSWNEIILNEPYPIDVEEDIWVTFAVKVNKNTDGIICTDNNPTNSSGRWFTVDGDEWNRISSGDLNIRIVLD